ncbi:hypothetical protein ACOME3_000693 [Neoechinorhynchus agilis]
MFKQPMILIAAGTGIAPFRGFLQEWKYRIDNGTRMGPATLYYGCRASNECSYLKELEALENDSFFTLRLAYSREMHHIHVTDLLKEDQISLWTTIKQRKGNVYICGDANKLGKSALECLSEITVKQSKMTKKETKFYWENMIKSGRCLMDVW